MIEKMIASEFIWGIVIGVVLTIVATYIAARLQTKNRKDLVISFCEDLSGSIVKYIDELEKAKARGQGIDHKFLEAIKAEINVYGRNREHLANLSYQDSRNNIRDFFVDLSIFIVNVEYYLNKYYENMNTYNSSSLDLERENTGLKAQQFLSKANEFCNDLFNVREKIIDINNSLLKERRALKIFTFRQYRK